MKVLDIQRMSTEDGPGLRTTVFLKGCPLACTWCHNPESIDPRSHVEWKGVLCIGCGICGKVCPQHGISYDADGVHTADFCNACGTCTRECPTQALDLKGVNYTVDDLYTTVIKDRAFWGGNGGLTVSGGEATLQWEDVLALFKKCKADGIHTALDTCGFNRRDVYEQLLPYTDIFLYDLKLFDDEEHKKYTEQSNKIIFENFDYLVDAGARIWVRTPIIPGATDTDENIRGLAGIVRDRVEKWELCAFNNLCLDKYDRLGKEWDFKGVGLMQKARMEELTELAQKSGSPVAEWSGATALES